jgi:hypothetical protein
VSWLSSSSLKDIVTDIHRETTVTAESTETLKCLLFVKRKQTEYKNFVLKEQRQCLSVKIHTNSATDMKHNRNTLVFVWMCLFSSFHSLIHFLTCILYSHKCSLKLCSTFFSVICLKISLWNWYQEQLEMGTEIWRLWYLKNNV